MKTKVLSTLFILTISTMTVLAGNITKKVKVAGNCGMCETRIEKAAKAIEGVSMADWNKETQMIEVTFDSDITDLNSIQKAIAKVGHDTGKFKATDEVYNKLPGCCKYDRLDQKKEVR